MTARTDWKRARRPEEKEHRRETILQSAGALIDEVGLEGTGLNAIARRAGISKPNIYRYFESREAILMQLLLDEVEDWMAALERRLETLEGTSDIDAVAKALAGTISRRSRFCVLVAALAAVLEHNVSAETVTDFKRRLLGLINPTVSAVQAAVPALALEQAHAFMTMFTMAASGTWPHCNPAPVVKKVLAKPEFAAMRFDFKETMRNHAAALLRGILHG